MPVLREPKDISFERSGIVGKVFPTSEITSKSNFVLISTDKGHETTIIEHESDFVYYILEGEGYFEIEDEKQKCSKGDLVVIPAGAKFTYKGKLKMLLCVTPPWRKEQEEIVG